MPVSTPPGPYTQADCKTCNEALKELARLKGEMEVQLRAGVPCEDQLKACEFLLEQWAKWKSVNFPREP